VAGFVDASLKPETSKSRPERLKIDLRLNSIVHDKSFVGAWHDGRFDRTALIRALH
jgi:hypothetical protein